MDLSVKSKDSINIGRSNQENFQHNFSLGTYQNKHREVTTRAIDLQHNLQNTIRTKFMINLSSINQIT